ncbi:ionotropic receptor 56c [Cochliomyia hominivorax]
MNILKVLHWLLVIVAFLRTALMWDIQFMLRNILPLTNLIQTQEINWFISEQMDTESSENLQEFFNTIHRKTLITQMVLTNNSDIRILKTSSKRNYLGLVLTTGPSDPIMRVHDRVLLGRHFYMNFVILVKPLEGFTVAEELLNNLHRNNFQNTFLYVYYARNGTSDLWGVNPYPNATLERRTYFLRGLKSALSKYLSGGMDCMGYKFYTPLRLDMPGVFRYINKQDIVVRQGTAYRILNLFINYINGSIEPYPMDYDDIGGVVVNMKDTLDLIRSKEILLTAHAYALFNADDEIDKSYPLMVVRWCLMVPIRNTISAFYYPLMPFEKNVWYMVLFTLICLSAIDALWTIWEHWKNPELYQDLVWEIRVRILDNLCYLFNIAASRNIKRPSIVRFILYSGVFFQAFFLSVGYTSLLGSILTVTLFREEINTLDDLIAANISTMIIDYEFDFLLSGNMDLPYEFLRLIKPVKPGTFNHHQSALNQSFAYFVTDDRWHFLELQQKSLKQGLFKLTDICFGSFHLAFPMETDSPLWRNLEYFIYRVHSSGMLHYYESISFEHAIHAGYVQRFTPDNEYQAAALSHVSMVFLMLLIASALCFIIFLVECLHYRLRSAVNLSYVKKWSEIKWKFRK